MNTKTAALTHTPGTWSVLTTEQGDVFIQVADGEYRGDSVAMVMEKQPDWLPGTQAGNAALIATVPELLEELKKAHQIIHNALNVMGTKQRFAWGDKNIADGVDGDGISRAYEREAIIAKAEGRSV